MSKWCIEFRTIFFLQKYFIRLYYLFPSARKYLFKIIKRKNYYGKYMLICFKVNTEDTAQLYFFKVSIETLEKSVKSVQS